MRVFVTGGTGLVGRRVVSRLRERGDEVFVLSRSATGSGCVAGNPAVDGPWLDTLRTCDGIIHLAGESIAGHRWSKKFKAKVIDSRVQSTALIAQAIANPPTKVFVCASAVGYYGMFEDNPTEFVETDLPGSGFLADVCVRWEAATAPPIKASVRVAMIRVGMVLASDGGALPQLAKPFKWFLGGPVATGRQWVSWIHIDDIVGLFIHALDRPGAVGPINGTAPEPVTNWGFCHSLADVLKRPCWLRAPKTMIRLAMGEMAELATHGQRVIPMRAKELGYEFKYPLLDPALREALGRPAITSAGG